MEFDHVQWDARGDDQILAEIDQQRVLWLRVANFFERNLRLLQAMPRGQLVLWKLEHWGTATPFDRLPASEGVDVPAYAKEFLSLGHRVVPYTFTSRNQNLLLEAAPALQDKEIAVVPVAQKVPVSGETRAEVRTRLGIGADDILLGCGGLLHPAKGVDELAVNFLRSCHNPQVQLLCSVVPDEDGITEPMIRRGWEGLAGCADSSRLHLRVSDYGEWTWMCAFYRSIDVMLVNSVSDSWGRMVSEALGFSVPTLVREADCATNHLARDIVFVDGFDDFGASEFWNAVSRAQRRAPELAAYVQTRFSLPEVRDQFLRLMRRHTPTELLHRFDRLSRDARSLTVLHAMIDH